MNKIKNAFYLKTPIVYNEERLSVPFYVLCTFINIFPLAYFCDLYSKCPGNTVNQKTFCVCVKNIPKTNIIESVFVLKFLKTFCVLM